MSRPWILICPSTRGLGLALTQHLLRSTTLPILATARTDPAAARSSLLASSPALPPAAADRLHLARADVTDEASVAAAAEQARALFPPETHHLHLAFALPGVLHPEKSPQGVDYAEALETLRVNTLGPLVLMKWFGEFLPRKSTDLSAVAASTPDADGGNSTGDDDNGDGFKLPRHATWLTASARVGSIADNRLGGWYSYRASKAGVNSLTRSFDLWLRTRAGGSAIALAYHPGTVRTGLSREFWDSVPGDQLFSPQFAVGRMVGVVAGREAERDRGRCWDWRGEEVLP
ncbi:short-chain dehydrogenase/reductase-like protein [Whalleya microplaca]|nr:short-chain dehydrogenase/reductase-like protein [Whalleya microplaca]